MIQHKISNKKLSLFISVVYVLAGTIYSPIVAYNSITDGLLYYLLVPVTFIPSFILFVEPNPIFYILISQLITLGLIYLVVLSIVTSIRGRYEVDNSIKEEK